MMCKYPLLNYSKSSLCFGAYTFLSHFINHCAHLLCLRQVPLVLLVPIFHFLSWLLQAALVSAGSPASLERQLQQAREAKLQTDQSG